MRRMLLAVLIAATLYAAILSRPAGAAEPADAHFAQQISDPGVMLITAGAAALPLLDGSSQGGSEALRTVDALAASFLVAKALKSATRVPRPDGEGHDSFPSDHATLAFAAATMAADRHPKQAPYWYGGAALIAWSRVRLNRHRPHEVLAGAAIGYGLAKLERKLPRGLLIAPFVDPTGGGGLEARWSF